jgi:CRISPR-associated protein Csb3
MIPMKPSFTINVDPANPGQFFACCGLLELADRLWPGAEGWFNQAGNEFYIACGSHSLLLLLTALGKSKIDSSLGDDGLKRLGTLLSVAKESLTKQDLADKTQLQQSWYKETVNLSEPFSVALDWWWDPQSTVTVLKTWAAKQFVIEIARPLLVAIGDHDWEDDLVNCLKRELPISGLPFCFDAMNNTQNTARDYGVAPSEVKSAPCVRPLVELLTFIALQRFRPCRLAKSDLLHYATWTIPLTTNVAGVSASSCLSMKGKCFAFRMLYRTKYMKAFFTASPIPFLETKYE